MSFLSTILKGVSNPFIRQIATGVAGAIKGQAGADLVNKGFTLFDSIKSAFEQFKAPASTGGTTNSSLRDPRTANVGSSSSASTAQATSSSKSASTASGGGNIQAEVSGGMGGYGLTDMQNEMLKESGMKPGSTEYKQQVMQMKMANYTNMISMLSNISKMLSDLSASIIRNIRS